jgi:PAS domain S-box-containing protein
MAEPSSPTATLRLAAIVESSDDAIVSKDLNGIVTSWNQAAERVFGYTAEEMIGKSITTIVPPDRLAEEAVVLRKIRRGEAVNHFETIRMRKDGSLVPISLTVSPIRARNGTIVGASKIARDISERRRAEQALADAERRRNDLQVRLMALAEGSSALFQSPEVQAVLPAAIELAKSLIPADGYAIWRFDEAGQAWTVAASEGLSRPFVDRIISIQRGRATAPLPLTEPLVIEDVSSDPATAEQREAMASEGVQSMLALALTIRRNAAGTLVFYYRTRHIADPNEVQIARAISNLIAAALTTGELYDEQKVRQDEATRAYAQASEANRAKDEFLATLSHELRTPLNAVLGWARMLRSGSVGPDRTVRALEVIERNAEAQLRLVEDMLDLSRIITGNLRLDVQPTRVSQAIAAAVETILPAAKAKEIAIVLDANPLATVMGDQARLQQVVWNLLANAVKFTPRGGSITIALRADASTVEMEVADTGEGIAAEILPYVFDRFRQGESGSTRTQMGLGLGLAIVRHIVEMHGGRVTVKSGGKDQGATFTLSFPSATREQALPMTNHRRFVPLAASQLDEILAGVRALVVDDDPEARDLMAAMLEARGVQVRTAASAREGLLVLENELPDVILSDLAMPDQDGYDLIRELRRRSASSGGLVPAIAVSAYARTEDSARSLASGFQIHLTKPIDPNTLYSAIERLAIPSGSGAGE